jgi:transcriptional regulator with XRE-family HTH domain
VNETATAARAIVAMRAAGLTQAELAQAMDISDDKLSKCFHGKRRFSSLELALMAEATRTSVESLLGIEIRVYGSEEFWRKEIAAQVRRNCTITPTPGHPYPRDETIAAVADWIENPPEWVAPITHV